eukprot:1521643-Amphidinium_carterae.1
MIVISASPSFSQFQGHWVPVSRLQVAKSIACACGSAASASHLCSFLQVIPTPLLCSLPKLHFTALGSITCLSRQVERVPPLVSVAPPSQNQDSIG